MIRFSCDHCGQKIRVADAASGKKGSCPHCRQLITIPELALQDLVLKKPVSPNPEPSGTMIDYECRMCCNALSAPKEQQGQIKECPHCGSFVEVPVPQKKAAIDTDGKVQLQPKTVAKDDYEDSFDRDRQKISGGAPQKPKRQLPIFLDVLLFPFSKPGLFLLIAFTFAPLLFYPVAYLGCFGAVMYIFLMICVLIYMSWYFTLCVQRSAEGDVRAPDTFNEDVNTTMGDMVLQLLRTIFLIIVCLLPPFIYRIATKDAGGVFYGILAGCTFFLPMMLLASVMFDSFWAAWNPRVILGGMFSSFFGYLVLVLVFYVPIGLYGYVWKLKSEQENLALALVLNGCSIYLIMVSSHMLGWFFYKNEEKLYWSV